MHRRLAAALEDYRHYHRREAQHDEQRRNFLKAVERPVERENDAEGREKRSLRPDAEEAHLRSVRKMRRRLEEYIEQRHRHQHESGERRRRALYQRGQRRDIVGAVFQPQHHSASEEHREQHDARNVIEHVLAAGALLPDREIAVKPRHPRLSHHHKDEEHGEPARIEHTLNPRACQKEEGGLARRYEIPLVGERAQPRDERDEAHQHRGDRAEGVDLQQSLRVLQILAGDGRAPAAARKKIKRRRRELDARPHAVRKHELGDEDNQERKLVPYLRYARPASERPGEKTAVKHGCRHENDARERQRESHHRQRHRLE